MMKNKKLFYGIIIILVVIIVGVFVLVQFRRSPKLLFGGFCGSSTYGSCNSNIDCKTSGCSGEICHSRSEKDRITPCFQPRGCYSNEEEYNLECNCIKNKCQWSK